MWCCHKYYTQSWGMPFININGSHKTYGQFCCVECVSAYCFDDISLTDDKKWEIYSIINNIARKIYEDPTLIVKLAAPRNSLKLLGGKYSIDEFRALNKTKDKVVKIFLPPTVSILYNIEEMTEESISCDIDNNNISKSQDNMFSSIQKDETPVESRAPMLLPSVGRCEADLAREGAEGAARRARASDSARRHSQLHSMQL